MESLDVDKRVEVGAPTARYMSIFHIISISNKLYARYMAYNLIVITSREMVGVQGAMTISYGNAETLIVEVTEMCLFRDQKPNQLLPEQ
eukprot:scaffold8039_cov89-Cylindrotheca_fusiformis.AAC.1